MTSIDSGLNFSIELHKQLWNYWIGGLLDKVIKCPSLQPKWFEGFCYWNNYRTNHTLYRTKFGNNIHSECSGFVFPIFEIWILGWCGCCLNSHIWIFSPLRPLPLLQHFKLAYLLIHWARENDYVWIHQMFSNLHT